jgi:hypothetical protein
VKAASLEDSEYTIPSAVIMAGILLFIGALMEGNNIAGHTRLFTQIKQQLKTVSDGPVIVVSAAEVSNLQTLLRKIVSGCLQIDIPEEEDDEIQTSKVFCRPTLLI